MLSALGVRSRSVLRSLGGLGRHSPASNSSARHAEAGVRTHCSGVSFTFRRAHAPAARRLASSHLLPGCQISIAHSLRVRPFCVTAGRRCQRRENAAGTDDRWPQQDRASGSHADKDDNTTKDYGTGVVGVFNRSIGNYPAGMCGIFSLCSLFIIFHSCHLFVEHILARSHELNSMIPTRDVNKRYWHGDGDHLRPARGTTTRRVWVAKHTVALGCCKLLPERFFRFPA